MEPKFKFDLVDIIFYEKDNQQKAKLVIWCKYGFVIEIYTTKEKAIKLQEISIKNQTKDITQYINVYWSKKNNNFSYSIEI